MTHIKDLNRLTQGELGLLWGISTRTIQRLPNLDELRHGAGITSYYVWAECLAYDRARLSQSRGSRGGETVSDSDRIKHIKADDAELNFLLKLKTLCLVEDVRMQWGNECAAMRARLLSIPATVSVRIDSTTTQAQREQIIRDEIHEALAALSADLSSAVDAAARSIGAMSEVVP